MSAEMFAYPFLFVAIFMESFMLVTLLSKPARAVRARARAEVDDALPTVAVIVPCRNGGDTIAETTRSLLGLEYPAEKLEIVLVDNGSTDDSARIMARLAEENPRVKVISEAAPGKHNAVNAGIAATRAEIVGCMDDDSLVEPDALREIIPCFANDNVAAATGAMSIYKPGNLLQHMQNAEYIFGIMARHAVASVNGLHVTPGPFSFYRRSVIEKIGGFRHGHQTEDMEMALRIQKHGYAIDNAPRARVYTKSPDTLPKLLKQRTRWTSGFLRNVLGEYRGLILNRRHAALGMIVLPVGIIAIVSGILLFSVMTFDLVRSAVTAFQLRAGIPVAYAYMPRPSFDWFYFPSSMYLFLAALVISSSLTLIIVGKYLSRTPGNIGLGLVSYSLLYGIIAPLWLIRSATDVAFGKRRGWR